MKLAVLTGSPSKSDVVISGLPYTVGRCRSADFIVAHVNVSRNHCQIFKENGLWKVSDFSSSGTYVNDTLVGKGVSVIINNGDCIRFGPLESNLRWKFYSFDSQSENSSPLRVKRDPAQVLKPCNKKSSSKEKHLSDTVLSCSSSLGLASEENKVNEDRPEILKNFNVGLRGIKSEAKLKVTEENIESNSLKDVGDSQNSECLLTKNPNVEVKSEREKIQELRRELQEVHSALNDLEEKNSALEVKLAAGVKDEAGTKKTASALENFADLMESEFQCTICSELFVTAVTLSCTHTFCKYCINQWKKKQKTCPICRKKITNETRSLVVDNYIDKVVGDLSNELKERREIITRERSESEPCRKRSKIKYNK